MPYATGKLAQPLWDEDLSDGWSLRGRFWVVGLLVITMAMAATALARVSGLIGSQGGRVSLEFSGYSILFAAGAVIGVVIASVLIARAPYRADVVALVYFLTYFDFASAGWAVFSADPMFEQLMVLGEEAVPSFDALAALSLLAGLAGMTLIGASLAWYLRFCSNFPKPLDATLFVSEAPSALGGMTGFLQRRLVEHRLQRRIEVVWVLFGMILPAVVMALTPALVQAWNFLIYFVFPGTIFIVGASYLRVGYRTADAAQQRQILWLVNACVIMGALYATQIVTYPFYQLFGSSVALGVGMGSYAVMPLIFNAGLLVAVFYDGAINPALVIRRTTVFGMLGVIFVFLFAGLGNAASELVEERLGLPGLVGSVMYGGVVAVLLLPLRRRFERAVERWMPSFSEE